MSCGDDILTMSYCSPCGELVLGAVGSRLCMCDWVVGDRVERTSARLAREWGVSIRAEANDVCREAAEQLDEYFSGRRRRFGMEFELGGTEFSRRVREALLTIPYGSTASYAQVAAMAGRASAVRAAARAIAANPLSIFIPCHRVIGSGGSLTGYAGTLPAKRHLLSLESPSPHSLFDV